MSHAPRPPSARALARLAWIARSEMAVCRLDVPGRHFDAGDVAVEQEHAFAAVGQIEKVLDLLDHISRRPIRQGARNREAGEKQRSMTPGHEPLLQFVWIDTALVLKTLEPREAGIDHLVRDGHHVSIAMTNDANARLNERLKRGFGVRPVMLAQESRRTHRSLVQANVVAAEEHRD